MISEVELPNSRLALTNSRVELPSSRVENFFSTVELPSSTLEKSFSRVEFSIFQYWNLRNSSTRVAGS